MISEAIIRQIPFDSNFWNSNPDKYEKSSALRSMMIDGDLNLRQAMRLLNRALSGGIEKPIPVYNSKKEIEFYVKFSQRNNFLIDAKPESIKRIRDIYPFNKRIQKMTDTQLMKVRHAAFVLQDIFQEEDSPEEEIHDFILMITEEYE